MRDRLTFLLEIQIQRGARRQLLLMAALISLVALLGGLAAWLLTDVFSDMGDAIWWSFLRLTDPGYLGDDEGYVLRTISTIVTVLGYVLFMGTLIAIMTQWLNLTMRTLESGRTPISMNDHFLILGWTNRTATIVRELLLSEGRVRRFLQRRGTSRLKIVILSDEVGADLRSELREVLGKRRIRGQIFLRSGSSMRIEHLRRVDFTRAAAILIPGADYAQGGPEGMDSRVIKTLMSVAKYRDERALDLYPTVVAEIFDARKAPIAQNAYQGPLHVLSGDAFISRLIAQNVRHRGLSHIYAELLSHTQGNEVYIRTWPFKQGAVFASLHACFPRAIVLGVVRPAADGFRPILNPLPDFRIDVDDRLIVIARGYDDAVPEAPPASYEPSGTVVRATPARTPLRRVLVLGWSHKAFALVQEFHSYPDERFDVDMVSVIDIEERTAVLQRMDLDARKVRVRQLDADFTIEADLRRIEPERYDNIIFLGSDWLDSSEETDARTVLGYVLLRSLLDATDAQPAILVELKDPANERLFQPRMGEVIISPVILSHMLAHAALRQELTGVFNELFGPSGAEILFRPASHYGLQARAVRFPEIQRFVAERGEIALGIRTHKPDHSYTSGITLNPSRQREWLLDQDDDVVVLTTYT